MKKRISSTLSLALMIISAHAAFAVTGMEESISLRSSTKTTINVSVDGQAVRVDRYVDNYVKHPVRPEDQLINIYVPENATKSSPIIFYVNNGGWIANSYPESTIVDGNDYDGSYDKVGVALKKDMLSFHTDAGVVETHLWTGSISDIHRPQ